MKVLSIVVCVIVVISSSKCAAVTPVRLVDGPHPFAGRLEVFFQGEWGSVCASYFDNDDADVVCGMIRNSSRGLVNATIHSSGYYGRSNGPLMISRLDCSGAEEDIFFCRSSKWKSGYCPYYQDNVAIDCSTQVRLINNGYGMGRVEMLIDHRWATVCSSNFGTDEAEVLCRTMGLSSRNATYEWYGYGYGPSYVLNCDGTEEDVSECSISDGAYHYYCDHSRDVQIECGDTGIRLANGRTELQGKLEVEYRGRWLEFCPDGFGPNEARVACRMISNGTNEISGTIGLQYRSSYRHFYNVNHLKCNGNESDLSQCSSSPWGYNWCSSTDVVTLDCNSVRLTDGESSSYYQMGRVEVSTENGTWGTVCDDSFDDRDARVICRMLGFNGAAQAYVGSGRFPHGHGDIIIDNLYCGGYETDISECSSNPWFSHDCSHSEDAGVACFEYGYSTRVPYFPTATTQTEVSLRLVNGGYRSGRVEVYYHGQWGTICDSNFDHNDVKVICRALGMYRGSSYGVAFYGAHFGEGSGNVIIEDLECNGNEYHLAQCRSKTWLTNGCDHSRDVGVDCYAYRYDYYTTQSYGVISNGEYEGSVRLVNGDGRYTGRVEVFYNGQWGTICDDSFDRRDAEVICRSLGIYYGYSYVTAHGSAYYGQGSGPIMIDDLQCSGNEWGLSQCTSLPWFSNNCGHGEDAGVDCYSTQTTYPWWHFTSPQPKVTLDEVIHVNCDQNGWDIRIDMYKLREMYPNSKASDIYLGENTCTGSEDWRYLTFRQGLRECLTSETIGHDALVYRNELVYAERDPLYQFIIRNYNWTVAVECDVQRNETSSGHLHHDSHHSQEPQISGSSHFTVNMSFYSDPNFLNRISGNPLQVSVGEKVYVKVYTTTPDWSVKMRVHTCYAKPSQYSSDNMKFFLIRNGCEVDANTHLISQSAHETRFTFKDFEYTSNHEGIHVFCDAELCRSHDYSQQCQQTCNPVIRRRIHVEEHIEESTTVTSSDDTTIERNRDETTIERNRDETTIETNRDETTIERNRDETTIIE